MIKKSDSNLINVTFAELIQLGYKKVETSIDHRGNINPPPAGSMLCLVNTGRDFWAELSASDIKASKVTPDKFLILAKNG